MTPWHLLQLISPLFVGFCFHLFVITLVWCDVLVQLFLFAFVLSFFFCFLVFVITPGYNHVMFWFGYIYLCFVLSFSTSPAPLRWAEKSEIGARFFSLIFYRSFRESPNTVNNFFHNIYIPKITPEKVRSQFNS